MHDMSTIVQPISLLVSDERDRAAKIHGECFYTYHDGYGVIAEEAQEARDCLDRVEVVLQQLLRAIREDRSKVMVDLSGYIRDTAVHGAAELVQVAAMCEKMTATVKEVRKI